MAHYALLDDNNVVTSVIVGENENVGNVDWEEYYAELLGQRCLRTSYNTRGGVHFTDGVPSKDQSKAFRGNYAGIGYTYDEDLDAFIPPKPFESWVLDTTYYTYNAPIPYPDDDKPYHWDEDSLSWVKIVLEV